MYYTTKKIIATFILFIVAITFNVYAGSAVLNSTDGVTVHITTAQKKLTEQINTTNVGNTILFGHYEQDNVLSNGKEPIEWILLSKDNKNKVAVLLSLKIIDCQRFDGFSRDVTWDNSSLRKHMNTTMLNEMFSEEEFHCINKSHLNNFVNHYYGTYSGEDTDDYIYIPSIDDIYNIFSNPSLSANAKWNELLKRNVSRTAVATKYAIDKGVRVTSIRHSVPLRGNYLLRTIGLNGRRIWYNNVYSDYYVSYITELGEVRPDGTGINSCDDGIRPMIQVFY